MNQIGSQLLGLISTTRRRRRWLQACRGLALTAAAGTGLVLILGIAAQHYRYSGNILITLRSIALLGLLTIIYFSLFRPLLKGLPNLQLARLIEERLGDLNERFVTAVEFSSEDQPSGASEAIINRLIDEADRKATEINLDQITSRRELWSYGCASGVCLLLFFAVLLWGPRQLSKGVAQLIAPANLASANGNLQIIVKPGNARVPKGSDQQIVATLVNFGAEEVTLFARNIVSEQKGDATWNGQAMEPAKHESDFQFSFFNIQDSMEYFVESNGVKSEAFKLDVADLPYVKRIDLLLNFPAYTQLKAQAMDDASGVIAALQGTIAQIKVHLTGNAKAAYIRLRDGQRIEMQRREDGVYIGQLLVHAESSYHIELVSVDGETYNGSNEFDITLLEDRPPVVSLEKPGRDTRATSIEEVFTQAKAEDDYGVIALEMYYSVNGGAEKKVDLQRLKSEAAQTLSGTHTFFLEELGLKPGDFVSYYAKARDSHHEATSDIYFIEVRPFELQFKQAQQQGGAGGDGQGEQQNALARRQKEIIAATFRLAREQAGYTVQEKAENYNAVALGQERLQNDTNALVYRIMKRFEGQFNEHPEFAKLVEHLLQAIIEMKGAVSALKAQSSKDGLPPEQRALQQLLQADAIFREAQVAFGNSGDQGGGSGAQSNELADLFELELDKMKNQYETLRQEQRQQNRERADEAQRKLEELSRRQQQALEQMQRRQQEGPRNNSGGGGGGRQQQQMVDETRRAARELERLSRQLRDQRMQELSQQLNQAADDMQRAQAATGNQDQTESIAQGLRALQHLEEAKRRLNQTQQANRGQSIEDLRQRGMAAAARQQEIARAVEAMRAKKNSPNDPAGSEAKQRLAERKDALAEAVNNLEKDLDQAARSAGPDGRKAGDQLREAASALRRNRVADRIRWNKQNIESDQLDEARAGERVVQENLNEVNKLIQAAEKAAKQPAGDGTNDALEKTRQLADNLESLRRRLNNGSQQNGSQQSGSQQNGSQRNGSQQNGSQQGGGRAQSGSSQSQQGQNQMSGQQGQGSSGQSGGASRGRASNSPMGSQDQASAPNATGGGIPAGGDRQLSAELGVRSREAEDLRRQLGRDGNLSRTLDKAIQQLQRLRENPVRDDTQTGEMLKTDVIDLLRQIEMELSRRMQAKLGRGNPRLSEEGVPPDSYRKLVEEYYKRLSNRSLVQ